MLSDTHPLYGRDGQGQRRTLQPQTPRAIAKIANIVAGKPKVTTLTIRESTRRRLTAYKRGDSSFDDVLNRLMDKVDLEDIVAEDIAEHYRILNDPEEEWVDGLQVAAWLRGERKEFPATLRKGPRRSVPSRDAKARAKAA